MPGTLDVHPWPLLVRVRRELAPRSAFLSHGLPPSASAFPLSLLGLFSVKNPLLLRGKHLQLALFRLQALCVGLLLVAQLLALLLLRGLLDYGLGWLRLLNLSTLAVISSCCALVDAFHNRTMSSALLL